MFPVPIVKQRELILWIDRALLGIKLSFILYKSNLQNIAKNSCRESRVEGLGCMRYTLAMV